MTSPKRLIRCSGDGSITRAASSQPRRPRRLPGRSHYGSSGGRRSCYASESHLSQDARLKRLEPRRPNVDLMTRRSRVRIPPPATRERAASAALSLGAIDRTANTSSQCRGPGGRRYRLDTAQTGSWWTSSIRRASQRSESAPGGAASWSRCSPSPEGKQTSTLFRLRSNPACKIEVGPPLSSLLGNSRSVSPEGALLHGSPKRLRAPRPRTAPGPGRQGCIGADSASSPALRSTDLGGPAAATAFLRVVGGRGAEAKADRASQPTSRAGLRRLRAESRRDWARR